MSESEDNNLLRFYRRFTGCGKYWNRKVKKGHQTRICCNAIHIVIDSSIYSYSVRIPTDISITGNVSLNSVGNTLDTAEVLIITP